MLLSLSKWNSTVALEIPLIRKGTVAKGKFIWTNEMEKEYNTVRNTILEQISLTPVDERKTLRLIIDRSLRKGSVSYFFNGPMKWILHKVF